MDLTFLKSTRFWAVVIIAVVGYLESKGLIGETERTLIWTIAGGFGIVRTVDRIGDKIGGEEETTVDNQ